VLHFNNNFGRSSYRLSAAAAAMHPISGLRSHKTRQLRISRLDPDQALPSQRRAMRNNTEKGRSDGALRPLKTRLLVA